MTELDIEQARHNMVEQQVRTWDVLDQRVLDTMLQVPREDFVPPAYRNLAFTDMELPLGHGEVMMAPKVEGRLIQALEVTREDTVLEVGTGSGYVTALLARLARVVYSVDIHPEFTEAARRRLAEHDTHNIALETGDAANGWDLRGPYDVIAVTGSVPTLTDAYTRSLKEGGRLFIIVGEPPAMEAVRIVRLQGGHLHQESLFETVLPPLVNAPQPRRFSL